MSVEENASHLGMAHFYALMSSSVFRFFACGVAGPLARSARVDRVLDRRAPAESGHAAR